MNQKQVNPKGSSSVTDVVRGKLQTGVSNFVKKISGNCKLEFPVFRFVREGRYAERSTAGVRNGPFCIFPPGSWVANFGGRNVSY